MINDRSQRPDEESPADAYEAPSITDLGALQELTLGNKNFPRNPDGSFGDFPIGS